MFSLKKWLLVFLVLSTLSYSSAWAFDGHALEQIDIEFNSQDITTGNLSDEVAHGDIACDHCCHMSSHLVAIFPDANGIAPSDTSVYISSLNEGSHSFIPGLDSKPPRL